MGRRAGLIERASDPHDRRGTRAVLTRSGRSVMREAMKAHRKLTAQPSPRKALHHRRTHGQSSLELPTRDHLARQPRDSVSRIDRRVRWPAPLSCAPGTVPRCGDHQAGGATARCRPVDRCRTTVFLPSGSQRASKPSREDFARIKARNDNSDSAARATPKHSASQDVILRKSDLMARPRVRPPSV